MPIHLVKDGGAHRSPAYAALNPQMRVPALDVDGEILTQSTAILEWIEENWPDPPLLPEAPLARARVRAIAATICCDIAPLQNSGTQGWLKAEGGFDAARLDSWLKHWIGSGLAAVEALLARHGGNGPFFSGSQPGLAECCLVPQLFGARRFGFALDAMPRCLAIEAACAGLPAFRKLLRMRRPDAE